MVLDSLRASENVHLPQARFWIRLGYPEPYLRTVLDAPRFWIQQKVCTDWAHWRENYWPQTVEETQANTDNVTRGHSYSPTVAMPGLSYVSAVGWGHARLEKRGYNGRIQPGVHVRLLLKTRPVRLDHTISAE
ncbi:hypothetical protein Bbelb_251540 [Branchiostoma belcheri]|nr:hypothetical protein Bbelb_251540 [Branchiostoma belcheri]